MNTPNAKNYKNIQLSASIDENTSNIESILAQTADLLLNPFLIGGVKCNLVCFEGMVSTQVITNLILRPLSDLSLNMKNSNSTEIFSHIDCHMLMTIDKSYSADYGDLLKRLMNGFAVLLIDGVATAFSFGVQGFAARNIAEPSSEGNLSGARDGFVETLFSNMSLVRRRMKSPLLKFELFSVAKTSNTDVILAYMTDRVPLELVNKIKKQLQGMELESILGSGYIEPYLNDTKLSVFSGVSVTERPDVFCAKILEGRIGLLIDGSPFSIMLPYLFIENFQTLDDYNFRPYYTTIIRWIRYAAFFLAVFLPALYTAVTVFHPELFNHYFIMTLAAAEELTPLPLAVETLFVLFAFEIIREAGLRLPKSVGGAVSIVGGLLIGDAAVSAGIISKPLLLACALSFTASFVIPSLNQSITALRFISVIAGGIAGLYGVALAGAVILINICSLESYGAPVMSPLSPFTPKSMRDVLTRIGFKRMATGNTAIEGLKGVNLS
ncbi:MAG: spore germination protein [Oscillospiraceae bacterium]|nr:spore germination protein [Oscillospiraceae bacterium]